MLLHDHAMKIVIGDVKKDVLYKPSKSYILLLSA